MTAIAITYWPRLLEPVGQRVKTTWPVLLERLSVPRVCARKLDVPGFAMATFLDDRRSLANVWRVYAVGLDLDHGVNLDDLRTRFAASEAFVHTTWTSTAEAPRARVFLRLSRPVTGVEYRRVYAAVAGKVEAGGLVVDRAASDPSRLWFLPSIREHGAAFDCWSSAGRPVDVEAALEAAPPPVATPAPAPVSSHMRVSGGIDRARAYLSKCPGAVSGSGGHRTTFDVAQRMVRGFRLTTEEAYSLLANEWNPRCEPPWSERDLRRKVEQAAIAGRMGEIADRERAR